MNALPFVAVIQSRSPSLSQSAQAQLLLLPLSIISGVNNGCCWSHTGARSVPVFLNQLIWLASSMMYWVLVELGEYTRSRLPSLLMSMKYAAGNMDTSARLPGVT